MKAESISERRRLAFDVVVLTFPDALAARAASRGPLWLDLQRRYPSVAFLATTDPFGCRVGSGGGTLAALAEADAASSSSCGNNENNKKNVLVLHAGGQSSRCPTQMCFGKAWTTFPTTKQGLLTPIHLWLDFMFTHFGNNMIHNDNDDDDDEGSSRLPDGSVAVIAADTMLRIPTMSTPATNKIRSFDTNAVTVLTVPAPLETAKNHGVFVLANDDATTTATLQSGHGGPVACRQVLQKPSIDTMRALCATTTTVNGLEHAWIDTGVLVFLPGTARVLRRLVREPALYGCTRMGLETLYRQYCERQEQEEQTSASAMDMATFCARHALSIDLYTHILQSLRLSSDQPKSSSSSGTTMDWPTYRERFPELPEQAAQTLHEHLSPLSMERLWAEPGGQFLHLGTTRELMDFYTSTTTSTTTTTRPTGGDGPNGDASPPPLPLPNVSTMRAFAKDCQLSTRRHVVVSNEVATTSPPTCSTDAVLYHSVLLTRRACSVKRRSLVEFCHVQCHSIDIGDDCWVSGLRGNATATTRDVALTIPSGLVVQELSLNEQTRVYMVLGVNDPVKKSTILYGKDWKDVASRVGWSKSDIWDDDSAHTLWHAKVHPVLNSKENFPFMDLFAWLQRLDENNDELQSDSSMQQWLQRHRLSLAEIRQQANASLEFTYRESLRTREIPVARQLVQTQARSHLFCLNGATQKCASNKNNSPAAIDNGPINMDVITRYWSESYPVMVSWIENQMYDVLGALAMRFAAICDVEADARTEPDGIGETGKTFLNSCLEAIESQQMFDENRLQDALLKVMGAIDQNVTLSSALSNSSAFEFRALRRIFLAISTVCTRACVCGNVPYDSVSLKQVPVLNEWVLATAPARIDLSGGWSDTPPICYEFGSAVTGMSVLVDGYKPLSCRCRLLPNGNGILLRSEARSASDGEVTALIETELESCSDLRDFNDPSSKCALLKCALICLGFVSPEEILSDGAKSDIFDYVQNFFGTTQHVRVEIISTSLLPQGSGMGTSSILAGCVLAAISKCRGTPMPTSNVIHMVLELEQLLTTGGGFQDQANGLVGGIKRVTSSAGVVRPVRVEWERVSLKQVRQRLNSCLFLVFTGKTRLAKNILQQCLQRWSDRTDDICATVSSLVTTANAAAEALNVGDLDKLGCHLKEYWKQKKVMAGSHSGVEPPLVARILEKLYAKELIRAGSLCGAGGGGFLVILSKDGVTEEVMIQELLQTDVDTSEISWHKVALDSDGLVSCCLGDKEFSIECMR